jgi:hypothetical protein
LAKIEDCEGASPATHDGSINEILFVQRAVKQSSVVVSWQGASVEFGEGSFPAFCFARTWFPASLGRAVAGELGYIARSVPRGSSPTGKSADILKAVERGSIESVLSDSFLRRNATAQLRAMTRSCKNTGKRIYTGPNPNLFLEVIRAAGMEGFVSNGVVVVSDAEPKDLRWFRMSADRRDEPSEFVEITASVPFMPLVLEDFSLV